VALSSHVLRYVYLVCLDPNLYVHGCKEWGVGEGIWIHRDIRFLDFVHRPDIS
jgi:hypothetical protein